MWSPVIPKKVEPNRGDAPGHAFSVSHLAGNSNGASPSSIRCFHSKRCSTIKVSPNTIVARIHLRAVPRLPCFEAATAKTIVSELDNRTSVIVVEKAMLGYNGNGVGQLTLAARA